MKHLGFPILDLLFLFGGFLELQDLEIPKKNISLNSKNATSECTPRKTKISPEDGPNPKRKVVLEDHHFSGANC